MYNGYITMKPI